MGVAIHHLLHMLLLLLLLLHELKLLASQLPGSQQAG
jgi:hypothetical protein